MGRLWVLGWLELEMGCLRVLELEILRMGLLSMMGEVGLLAQGEVLVGMLVEEEVLSGSWDGVGERGRPGGAGGMWMIFQCSVFNIKICYSFCCCKIPCFRCDSYETCFC